MSNVEEVTSVEFFDEILKNHSHFVLKFWADWCGPCKRFAPHYEAAAASPKSDATEYWSIDVDAVPEIAARYGVQGIPTVLAFRDGDVVGSLQARTAVPLAQEVEDVLYPDDEE